MSKKDRLKAQSEKQLILKKELEQQELAEKAEASGRSSKAGEKLRKKARKANNILTLILKLLMILPFGYSAFYYGGIFIVGIATGEMVGMPKRIAVFLAIGAVLCLAGLFLAFFSRYILQFAFIAVGTASFMYSAGYIISETQKKLEVNYVSDAELQKLDKTYMTYFYPLLIMTLISAVLLAIYIVKRIKKKRAEKRERDNAPVKSIID
jgi:glucan phosphoethanolaminetransferase (alkaline phosphatase superfamily)